MLRCRPHTDLLRDSRLDGAGGKGMYEMKTAAEVLRLLGTDKDNGLGRREALERKAKYGANRLKDQ